MHEATEEYYASPLEDNLFEWHFTVQGPPSTDFEGGVYHGRILLPPEYPMKPPNIILLTVSGYRDQLAMTEDDKCHIDFLFASAKRAFRDQQEDMSEHLGAPS